jgi:hypothetical protein
MHTEVVTVLTASTSEDPYSDEPEESWDTPTEEDVTTLAPPEPRPTYADTEPTQDARNSITSGWTLYLPVAGPAITAKSRIRVRGVVYPVQGEPSVWDDVGRVVQVFHTEG